jgi:hypothetical protein
MMGMMGHMMTMMGTMMTQHQQMSDNMNKLLESITAIENEKDFRDGICKSSATRTEVRGDWKKEGANGNAKSDWRSRFRE